MASATGATTGQSYLEVPDINQTSFYSLGGPGYINLDNGDRFLRNHTDWFTKQNLGQEKANEYGRSVKAVRTVDASLGFIGQTGYSIALTELDMAKRHLSFPGKTVLPFDNLDLFIEEVRNERLRDFRAQVDAANIAIESLALQPWMVLRKRNSVPPEFRDPVEENKRWLARIVGVEVVLNKDGEPKPGAILTDLNGNDSLVLPEFDNDGLVIQIN